MSLLITVQTTTNRTYKGHRTHTRVEVAAIVRASVKRVSAATLRERLTASADKRAQRLYSVFMDAIAHTTYKVMARAQYYDMMHQDAYMWAGGYMTNNHNTADSLAFEQAADKIVPSWDKVA